MTNVRNVQMFSETSPVEVGSLPNLTAYFLDMNSDTEPFIGAKFAYRLRREFGGHWVWTTDNWMITDFPQAETNIAELLNSLWNEEPYPFRDLYKVTLVPDWRVTPQAQADFVARGLIEDLETEIAAILKPMRVPLRDKNGKEIGGVERSYDIRGWVVQGEPAISISISSNLISNEDFKAYSQRVPREKLRGLWAKDKTSNLKGEISEVLSGTLKDHRSRLMASTKRPELMHPILQKADDNELVVKVNGLDYPVIALSIVLMTKHYRRFGVNSYEATSALRIAPQDRYTAVKKLHELIKNKGWVNDKFYGSSKEGLFLTSADIDFSPRLRFANNVIEAYEEKRLWQNLVKHGLYHYSNQDQAINIGIISPLNPSSPDIKNLGTNVRGKLETLKLNVGEVHVEQTKAVSRSDFDKAIKVLMSNDVHLILALLPGYSNVEEDEGEWEPYYHFKSLTLREYGIPSQVLYQGTMNPKKAEDLEYRLQNIALGVASKMGNIPFVLADPLPYTDLLVGIDIARDRNKRGSGSRNASAFVQVYGNNGSFSRYRIEDTQLEGETVPRHVLQSMFPRGIFEGKRTIIHRDGLFRGDEVPVLSDWAVEIGADFYFVEVIKSGAPRIYGWGNKGVEQPPKWGVFRLSGGEVFAITSTAYKATPQPLQIRIQPSDVFTIEQAIHSVFSLTLMHHGSLRPPKTPTTIHYSDIIGYLALRGVKPAFPEGTDQYWL